MGTFAWRAVCSDEDVAGKKGKTGVKGNGESVRCVSHVLLCCLCVGLLPGRECGTGESIIPADFRQ